MRTLSVHALDDERLVVSGDDGTRWMLDAPQEALRTAELETVLSGLRRHASGTVRRPIAGSLDLRLRSLEDLVAAAADVDHGGEAAVALWSFAGRLHRVRLQPGRASDDVRTITRCLRATVSDPATAAALCRAPLADDVVVLRDARLRPPPIGVIDRWDGGWAQHPFDPMPLVDTITGVLRRVIVRPHLDGSPNGFRHVHAELPHLESVDPHLSPDPLAPIGLIGASPSEVQDAGIHVGVATYCGAYLGQGRRRLASEAELDAAGERTLSVDEWRPHAPELHAMTGFPFRRASRETVMWWLRAEDDDGPCFAPLSLVHAGHQQTMLAPLPVTNGHNLVGLQAGRSPGLALENACAHVLAHDAVARWWRGGEPAAAAPCPPRVTDASDGCGLGLRILAIPGLGGLPVRLAVVDDRERDIVSLGFAADADADEAATAAVGEALAQYASARDLAGPDSLIRDAERIGNGGAAGLAGYRADRRYAGEFGPGLRGLIDPMCHVQYGLDPAVTSHTRARSRPGGPPPRERTTSAVAALRGAGLRIVHVDVTTDEVAAAGMHACRVLVPGLERIQPAAFPLRVDDAPPYPGW